MSNQLEFENYILRNGTNVTNEKLQGLLFFSLIAITYRSRYSRNLEHAIIVKDNYALVKGAFERYKKYGEEIIPVPSKALHLSIKYEVHLDAILKTYDQFDGKQLTQLIRDTGLLDNYNNGYFNMKDYWSYYKSLIKNNLKINRKEKIYQNTYLTLFEVIRWTFFVFLLIMLFVYTTNRGSEYRPYSLFVLLASVISTNIFSSYYRIVHTCIEFNAVMRVEKAKLANQVKSSV